MPPFEPVVDYERHHYFLGLASQVRLDDQELDPAQQKWSAWEVRAVCQLDGIAYPEVAAGEIELAPGDFFRRGICRTCKSAVASNAKVARCSICGARVFLH
jgi:hypothetical protein